MTDRTPKETDRKRCEAGSVARGEKVKNKKRLKSKKQKAPAIKQGLLHKMYGKCKFILSNMREI